MNSYRDKYKMHQDKLKQQRIQIGAKQHQLTSTQPLSITLAHYRVYWALIKAHILVLVKIVNL